MAAQIVTVTPQMIWTPERLERLWFFPNGSEYLRYAPHFHAVYPSGFRTNLPLNYMFVVVLEGKLSVKNFYGETTCRIEIRDQVWYTRGTNHKNPRFYAMTLPGKEAYARSGR